MDLIDLLTGGSEYVRANKPATLDMDRISEITLEMKVEASEGTMPEREARWRARIEEVIDFDSLAYQAMQVALQLHNIKTVADLQAVRRDNRKNNAFIATIQGFYDGFLLAAAFQQRGGHRP